jgi:hypothetical protein
MRGGKSISDLVAKVKGKGKFVETMVFVGMDEELNVPETSENYFGRVARKSDAIISGRVTKKTSQIAENDSFIFTDYAIEIAEVLRNNLAAPVETGATVTVTRPGGKVVLDDVIVKATDYSFAPLLVDSDVILFLKFIPETGTYCVTEPTASFELDGSSLHPLTQIKFPPGVLKDKSSFLHALRLVSEER